MEDIGINFQNTGILKNKGIEELSVWIGPQIEGFDRRRKLEVSWGDQLSARQPGEDKGPGCEGSGEAPRSVDITEARSELALEDGAGV